MSKSCSYTVQYECVVNCRLLSRKRDVVHLFTVIRVFPPHATASARNVAVNLEPGTCSPIQSLFHVETKHLSSGTFLTPTAAVDVATSGAFLGIDILRAIVAFQLDIVASKVELYSTLAVMLVVLYVPVIFQKLVFVGHGRPPAQLGQDVPLHVVGIPRLAEQLDELPIPLELLEMGAQVFERR